MTSDSPSSSAAPTALSPRAFAPAEIAGVRAPLVGRGAELKRLLDRFYMAAAGHNAGLLIVSGPPGSGKSRLAYELLRTLGDMPEPAQIFSAQATSLAAARPYELLRQLVARQFAIGEGLPELEAASRLEHGISAALGSDGAVAAALIGQLVGIGPRRPPSRDPRQLREQALRAVLQWLRAVAPQGPLLVLLDSLHDADDASLDAIEQLARAGRDLPLLVLGLAQPRLFARRLEWASPAPWRERLDLAPLSEHDVRRLVGEILRKAGKLPPELRALVVQHAEGNPRYIEELIKALIADGVIVPGPTNWQVLGGRLARVRLPGTLAELLRARVVALGLAEQELLARAAVVGKIFWPGALAALDPGGARPGPALAALTAEGLVAPRPESQLAGETEYSFQHALAQEVAYGLAPPAVRTTWHRSAAGWLQSRGAPAALVAAHLERAGQAEEAGLLFLRAGQQAAERYAVEAGIEAYRRGLRLLPATPATRAERISALEGLGHLLRERAELGAAIEAYRAMAGLAAESGDLAAEAQAWFSLARAQDEQIETRAAQESARHALTLAERANDRPLLVRVLVQLALAEMRRGRPLEARALCLRALDEEQLDDPAGRALALAYLGLTYEQTHDYAEARRHLAASIELNRAAGDLRELAYQLSNLGYTCNGAAEYEQALAALSESARVAAEAGSRMVEIFALSNLGNTLNNLGLHAEAEAEMRRGLELCRLSHIDAFPDFYRELALAELGMGRPAEAVEAAQEGLALARKEEDPREIAVSWRVLGSAFAGMPEHQGAQPCFAESVRVLELAGQNVELGRTLRAWARYELAHGDRARGRQLWAAARERFAAAGHARELERTPARADE